MVPIAGAQGTERLRAQHLVRALLAAQTLVTNGVATPEDVDRTYMIVNRGCAMGPMGLLDMVGLKTAYDICTYWGTVNKDAQMLANANYFKTQFLDKGLQGMLGGQGYYRYPDPEYALSWFPGGARCLGGGEIAQLADLHAA